MSDNNLFQFANGVYDLNTNQFRAGSIDGQNTGYAFEEGYLSIEDYLQSTLGTTTAVNDFLDKCYDILKPKADNRIFVIRGGSSSGKSLLFHLIMGMMGHYMLGDILEKPMDFKIMGYDLRNYRAIGFRDASVEQICKSANSLKAIVSGNLIHYRQIYHDWVEYVPNQRLVIVLEPTGTLESIRDRGDLGLFNRFECIDLPFRFVDNPTQPNEKKQVRYINFPPQALFQLVMKHVHNRKRKQPDVINYSATKRIRVD